MQARDVYDFHGWFLETYQALLTHRSPTFYQALMLSIARGAKTIVETGTSRQAGNWVDGQSTKVLGSFAQRYGCRLWTCDIDETATAQAREATADCAAAINYVTSDSVAFLKSFSEPIDLLYLDSLDAEKDGDPAASQDHALAEGQAALHALHMQSVILIDDCYQPQGGKGAKVIPFLLGQGWQIVGMNYQVLMVHAFSTRST